MAEPDGTDMLARLAALEALGWPDDRQVSAHIDPEDGWEASPPGYYWDATGEVVAAVASVLRRHVAEEIAAAIQRGERGTPVQIALRHAAAHHPEASRG